MSFETLGEASTYCDGDAECGGFYDNCAEGTTFKICDTEVSDENSPCGSIRYTKGKSINSSTNGEAISKYIKIQLILG